MSNLYSRDIKLYQLFPENRKTVLPLFVLASNLGGLNEKNPGEEHLSIQDSLSRTQGDDQKCLKDDTPMCSRL